MLSMAGSETRTEWPLGLSGAVNIAVHQYNWGGGAQNNSPLHWKSPPAILSLGIHSFGFTF